MGKPPLRAPCLYEAAPLGAGRSFTAQDQSGQMQVFTVPAMGRNSLRSDTSSVVYPDRQRPLIDPEGRSGAILYPLLRGCLHTEMYHCGSPNLKQSLYITGAPPGSLLLVHSILLFAPHTPFLLPPVSCILNTCQPGPKHLKLVLNTTLHKAGGIQCRPT